MGRPDRGAPVLSGSIIARRPGLSTGGRSARRAGRAFSAVGRWSGFGPAPVQTCDVGSRPTPGGSPAFSGESRKKERRGLCPLDPLLLWSARWHSLVLAWWDTLSRSLDYFGTHLRALIWRLSFPKMLFSIFYPENASQIGFSIPEEIAPQPSQSQQSPNPASGNERP